MPFTKVYIHCVWSTKNRFPFLNSTDLRQKVWYHIKENALKKEIYLEYISGYSDHCHCLISLGNNQTIQKTIQLLKGESSYWINKNQLTKEKFEWQDEYFAVGVCESMLENARKYVANQESHHRTKSFDDEFEDFLKRAGFERFNDKKD